MVRELSDREYDRKFSPKTIWDKLSEAHIACQMTLLDAQYFKKVRIYDLLQTDYSKHPDSTLVPLKNHFVKVRPIYNARLTVVDVAVDRL